MRAVNLIPAEQRKGAGGAYGRSDGAAYVIVGLLAGLVLMAVVYAISHSQVGDRRVEAARLSAQASAAQRQAAALSSYTSFLTLRDQRVSTVQQLAASRFDWAHAFHELGRVLPADVSLSSVHGSIAGATPAAGAPPAAGATGAAGPTGAASSTPPGATPSVSITGCTTTQKEVAFMLTRLRQMDGVATVQLNSAAEAAAAASGPATSGACPVGFQVAVSYNPLPAVSTPPAGAPTPAPSTPATATASATAPAAATPAVATTPAH